MKNRKIYYISFIFILMFGLFLVIKNSFERTNIYKKKIIENNIYIIDSLINKYPDLKDEIIDLSFSNINEFDINLLKKYDIDEDIINSYLFLEKDNLLVKDIICYLLFIFSLVLIYILYLNNERKKIKQIDNYILDILNNKDSFDIRDYNEDFLSKLKNSIYKITKLLKEEKENTLKEKKNLENLLSDISHQIKTPLTSMYVINDLLLDSNIKEDKKKEFLNKNRIQLERIEWLVSSLLSISRLDNGSINLKCEKVRVIDLINNALEPIKIPIELKNIKLDIDISDDIYINVDAKWTTEAIMNILKNAYEHTTIDGVISIKASINPIYTEISIKDNGIGIERDKIKHIFERFYKGNSSKESVGIGLNLAKTIIEKENGIITVSSEKNKYTCFKIRFYK